MELTYLGHAGFCLETEQLILIMDPWLSPDGAFDAAWFQFPCNHHMAAFVREKLQNSQKARYIYISHEHKDHFDPAFLHSLQTDDITFVIPHFRRTELYDALRQFPCKSTVRLKDGESLDVPNGRITLYLDDAETDRDSAILVEAGGKTFLNLNDCKIHDRMQELMKRHGHIHLFTAQFSGAVWHPICYDYPKKAYEAISMRKVISKFEAVARAILLLQPDVYLTSAGPACFLDPLLYHLNFERINIFPRAGKFLRYLQKRLKNGATECYEPMPGDVWNLSNMQWASLAKERVTEANYEAYIRQYAERYEPFFRARSTGMNRQAREETLSRLKAALREKLDHLTLRDRVPVPLYFRLADEPNKMLRVDFQKDKIEQVSGIFESKYYSIETPSWEIRRVLDGRLTWEDFMLTFRMRLRRDPDVYHIVIHGFLTMEKEDMNWFCHKVLAAESNTERILVEAAGKRYSVNRYCPHQGADLSQGWIENERFLVCPRHRWRYDLQNNGNCDQSNVSICAFLVEDN